MTATVFPRTVRPREATWPEMAPAEGSVSHSGHSARSGSAAIGRVWRETYPPLLVTALATRAFLAELERLKRSGEAVLVDHRSMRTLLGNGAGGNVARVNGAGQSGEWLVTDGWPSASLVLRAGDVLRIAALGPVYEVVEDVTSDGSGNATLRLSPPIFAGAEPSDDAVLTLNGTPGAVQFRAFVESVEVPSGGLADYYGNLSVSFRELVDPLVAETLYRSGDSTAGLTYDRNNAAFQRTQAGLLVSLAADVIRDAHYDPNGVRTTLVERGTENRALWSEDLTNAAWAKLNATIAANDATAPDGTATMDKLVESAVAGAHQTSQSWAITAGATVSYSHFAAADERGIIRLFIVDDATLANGCRAEFNLSTGVASGGAALGTGTFTRAVMEAVSGGYRCVLTGRIDGSTTTARSIARLCQSAGVDSYTGDGTSGAHLWGAQFEVWPYHTSYLPTTSSVVGTTGAQLSVPHTRLPEEGSLYFRFTEFGTFYNVFEAGKSPRIAHLGNNSDTGARLMVYASGGLTNYGVGFSYNGTAFDSIGLTHSHALFDTVELLAWLGRDGRVRLKKRINRVGTITDTGWTATRRAIPAAWSAATLWLGCIGAAGRSAVGFQKWAYLPGLHEMDEMAYTDRVAA